MAGHVFVARGDITRLACDAWLLPTDASGSVGAQWFEHAPPGVQADHTLQAVRARLPHAWGRGDVRAVRFDEWHERSGATAWLVNVGRWSGTPVEWYLEGVEQFVDQSLAALSDRPPLHGRSRPLVALPLVGTGHGGAADVAGEVVLALVERLTALTDRHDVDLALLLRSGPAFAAAQFARRQLGAVRSPWADLGKELVSVGARLAEDAQAGQLVLFLGAGIGRPAGLPDWEGLLALLAADVGMSDRERAALGKLNVLDRARILEDRLARQGTALGEQVASHLDASRFSLGHLLLANLPVNEIATMNYDTLFEAASIAAGKPLAVLPYEPATTARWILKVHGSVARPSDIVLTRGDYLRYAERRAALGAIVQALLITRHMLFVGFSLDDDNFHRIVDDVRKAIRQPGDEATRFGTTLLLKEDPLLEELWKADLDFVAMSGASGATDEAARRVEIFLDYVVAEASSNTEHLLDRTFSAVLSPDERALRDALESFESNLPPEARRAPAWALVAELHEKLGAGSRMR